MMAILLNALVIFLLYFPEFKDNNWLILFDHGFILFFLLEATVKVYTLKPKGYFANGWNRFDFLVVMVSLPTLLMDVLPLPDTSLLVLLRLFRLIRLIRFITFIPHLSSVMAGLGRALRASVFILLALFFLNFILAIFTCHFYSEAAPEYFGNPLVACYSIFQLFTLEGWYDIPNALAEHIESSILLGITRFYFVLIVLFGGIFGMSLANAVFVDEMTIDNNQVLEQKIDNLYKEIYELKELLKRQEKPEM